MPTTCRVTLADIEAIVDYINEREPVTAVRFVEAVERTLEHIADVPTANPMFRQVSLSRRAWPRPERPGFSPRPTSTVLRQFKLGRHRRGR